jgi:predicted transcriptional regulator
VAWCIPKWYRFGMSKQIAVRLPDELVAFVDDLATREAVSRAAIVTRALERERRRAVAARDVEILISHGTASDLHGLAEHLAGQPIDLD